MTDKTQLLPVTAEDRDAAIAMFNHVQSKIKSPLPEDVQQRTVEEIASHRWDRDEAVQAFARHRISHSLPGDVWMREALERIAQRGKYLSSYSCKVIAREALAALTPTTGQSPTPLLEGEV